MKCGSHDAGRAFLEHGDEAEAHYTANNTPQFVLYMSFQGQRLKALPIPASCDPFFNYRFVFKLPDDCDNPFDVVEPVHVVLMREQIGEIPTLVYDALPTMLYSGDWGWFGDCVRPLNI